MGIVREEALSIQCHTCKQRYAVLALRTPVTVDA